MGVPYMITHDGRTLRYPDPEITAMDTVKLDLETGKVTDICKFETGNLAMISGEKHQGSFDIVHLKDSSGHMFATRLGNVFVIGSGNRPMVSLPKRKGIKLTIMEERQQRPPKM